MKNYNVDFKKINRLAKKFKIKISFGGSYKQSLYLPSIRLRKLGYNGKIQITSPSLSLLERNKDEALWYSALDIIHEFGHLIVAAPSRRNKKDYGIPERKIGVNTDYWDFEEGKACLIEYKLCELLGITPRHKVSGYLKNPYTLTDRSDKSKLRKWWRTIGEKQTINAFQNGIN